MEPMELFYQFLKLFLIIYPIVTIIRYILAFIKMPFSRIYRFVDCSTGIFGTMGRGKDLLMTHIVRNYDKGQKSKLKQECVDLQFLSKKDKSLVEEYEYYLTMLKHKKSFVYSNIPILLKDKHFSYVCPLEGLALHSKLFYPYVDGDMIALSEASLIFPCTDFKYLNANFYSIEYLVKLIRHMFDGRFIYNDQHPDRIWNVIVEKTANFIQIKDRKEILSFTLTRKLISWICILPLPYFIKSRLYSLSSFLQSLSIQKMVLDIYTSREDYNTDLGNPSNSTKAEAFRLTYCFFSRDSYGKYDTRAFQFVGNILRDTSKFNHWSMIPQYQNIYLTKQDLYNLGYKKLTDILSANYKKGN